MSVKAECNGCGRYISVIRGTCARCWRALGSDVRRDIVGSLRSVMSGQEKIDAEYRLAGNGREALVRLDAYQRRRRKAINKLRAIAGASDGWWC